MRLDRVQCKSPALYAAEVEPQDIPLTGYLCLSLHVTTRAVDGLYRRLLEDLDLTYSQYLVMRMLWQGGPALVKDIAATLDLDYSTLSPLLKRLQAAGFVTKTRHAKDERAVLVALTSEGEALEPRARHVPAAVLDGMGLNGAEAKSLRLLLDRVAASAKAATRPDAPASS